MKTQSAGWVLPTTRFIINLSFYASILLLVGFFLVDLLKIMGLQPALLTSAGSTPNTVSMAVEWKVPGNLARPTAPTDSQMAIFPQKQSGDLVVPANTPVAVWKMLFELVGLGIYIWTLALLRKILQFGPGQSPFQAENARRISRMGFLFIGISILDVVQTCVSFVALKPYLAKFTPALSRPYEISISMSGPWLLGLILLVLSQVYLRGTVLEEEAEFTV